MLGKIKNTLNLGKDEQGTTFKPSNELITIFESEQIKQSRQIIDNIKQTLTFLQEIANNNKEAIKQYINEQVKNKQASEDPDQNYTFLEDLGQIKSGIDTISTNFKQLSDLESKIYSKVQKLSTGKIDDAKFNALEQESKKNQQELKRHKQQIKKIEDDFNVNSQLLVNSKQQTVLLTNEVKQLQDKLRKIQKQLNQKSFQVVNLQQQKTHLLALKNDNPQVQALKNQMSQMQKRISMQKSKVQQKQKQIQQLKKRIQQQKANLDSMADILKQSSFKQQQVTKKYQNSKVQIRKYRQQKIEQIKKLNDQILQANEKYSKSQSQINDLKQSIKKKQQQINTVKSSYSTIVSNNIKQTNLEQQFKVINQNLKQSKALNQQKQQIIDQRQSQIQQLKQKREALLKLIDQPVKHEVHNLQKIHKHMEQLYKDYIVDVFEQGNIVGFQRKIKDIMANVMELREDLLM